MLDYSESAVHRCSKKNGNGQVSAGYYEAKTRQTHEVIIAGCLHGILMLAYIYLRYWHAVMPEEAYTMQQMSDYGLSCKSLLKKYQSDI